MMDEFKKKEEAGAPSITVDGDKVEGAEGEEPNKKISKK